MRKDGEDEREKREEKSERRGRIMNISRLGQTRRKSK
jgi:hypothetical protein